MNEYLPNDYMWVLRKGDIVRYQINNGEKGIELFSEDYLAKAAIVPGDGYSPYQTSLDELHQMLMSFKGSGISSIAIDSNGKSVNWCSIEDYIDAIERRKKERQ